MELWSKEAPVACRNFVQLCMEGYYNGNIFHRIVSGKDNVQCDVFSDAHVMYHSKQSMALFANFQLTNHMNTS